ncbi:histidine kinase dimerization/phospho-acceptor domain-containing protein [Emticicia sp. SJ17W-69]|uniref:histidine kinase dimerization/phospho-acceptor domain-containing protein n=1 Tax=Emticicia sp. SJ17W-69 TaxID=3421657 RepID=UPI003EB851BD
MTLKKRIAINVAIAFSVLFGLASIVIYISFSIFRREEFEQRLKVKALTTAKLLVEVKEVDNQLLKLIDRNSINKLINEKILVFDDKFKLLYSSIDDATITWNRADLEKIKIEKSFFRSDKEKDVMGLYYDFESSEYYVLISAEDRYGNSKLNFLFYLLLTTFIVGTLLVWLSTNYFIKRLLKPLDIFQEQITNISINQLNVQLHETKQNDEINLLTRAFNILLSRIENAFESQREFAANASHEFRTPLTRISFKVENLLQNQSHSPETVNSLKSINESIHQLSDLVNSLLLLSKINREDAQKEFAKVRIDEVIFFATTQVKKTEPEFDLKFEIIDNDKIELSMEVFGVKSLLEIIFTNLLKNACLYSDNKKTNVIIEQTDSHKLSIRISNEGDLITMLEQDKLFQPFMRGSNSRQINGSGLGLRLSKRILDYHSATIKYQAIAPKTNQFEIIFIN